MERNRGIYQKRMGSFNTRGRNNIWHSNFNQANVSNNNSWVNSNLQNSNGWIENRGFNNSNVWSKNINSNQNTLHLNPNDDWSQPQQKSNNGYWKQVSTSNHIKTHSWQGSSNNLSRERRTPYDRPNRGRSNRPNGRARSQIDYTQTREPSPEIVPKMIPMTPLEAKIERLITAVQKQPDNLGQLILLQNNNEIPPVLINNAVHQVKNFTLSIDRNESTGYSKLRINNTVIAEGMYSSKKDAKEALYEMGLDVLKSKCFYITSKSHYEEVSMDDLNTQKKPDNAENSLDKNSKAVQMMLKMGWGGKGLGNKEQGEQKSVADKITENISREGLGAGGQSVMQEIDKILSDYAKSTKTITLGFDSGFTKEERAQIHAIASKYHLKSKSEGGFNNRRITISKKMSKWVLVRELLSVGLENQSYILTIPDEFLNIWNENK